MACMRQLLAARPRLYPQFATHNALTVASVIEEAGGVEGYEFQRLHGMGEVLYEALLADVPGAACRVYAPVGSHRDLLAYLVRRLLENGANSSFVAVAADPNVPVEDILKRPQAWIGDAAHARHPHIPLPRDLYRPARLNSSGVEFGDRAALDALLAEVERARKAPGRAADRRRARRAIAAGAVADRSRVVGQVTEADAATRRGDGGGAGRLRGLDGDAGRAPRRHPRARRRSAGSGARPADRAAAGRRRQDARRRARPKCARRSTTAATTPPRRAARSCRSRCRGRPASRNELRYRGRGVFVCISPWNFPLAIFLGQVTAALAAGNAVVAKPAEQTPLIAAEAVRLLHQAGVPASALHLVPGDGKVGAALVADPRVAGVAFTGSTEVGRAINRALAAKDGPIVPLIAETGGINAMIVDATALPEQVTDDVVTSAFRSAGQRCSALRLLCVQEDVADRMIEMIAGAARELALGDPRDPATHVGPVIDDDAKQRLDRWIADMAAQGRVHLPLGRRPRAAAARALRAADDHRARPRRAI